MYYIVYGWLLGLSYLPFAVLYLFSDAIYVLVFYVFGYRKKVVLDNLCIAFPEKSDTERLRIAKDTYHNLIDTFIETIKLLSLPRASIAKRFHGGNPELVNNYIAAGKAVSIVTGHFFNWEWANLGFKLLSPHPLLAVYMPVNSPVFDRIMRKLRARAGTTLISAHDFKYQFHQYTQQPYALALAADQNAGNPHNAWWVNFFGKPAPFVRGPERGAKKLDLVLIYAEYYKVKRGYYAVDFRLITETPNQFEEGELTKLFVAEVEKSVRKRPSNYLWTHRRWKRQFTEEYAYLKK